MTDEFTKQADALVDTCGHGPPVRACLHCVARALRAAHASGFSEGVEAAKRVFCEFRTTPKDDNGRLETTQEEVDRTVAAFLALVPAAAGDR